MFGDIPIYGQSKGHIDPKGRIVLPIFTGVEPNDKIVVLKTNEGIRIMDSVYVDTLIKRLEELAINELDLEKSKLIEQKVTNLCEQILKFCICDKNHRILMSNILKPNTEYLIIGCRNSVLFKEDKTEELSSDARQLQKEHRSDL